jgi:hypothetical protein
MTSNIRTLDEVLAVGRFLNNFPNIWWVGGGWAIDLWTGSVNRNHEDIEICVLRSGQETIYKYCCDWQFYTPLNNEWSPMSEEQRLDASGFMLQLRCTSKTNPSVKDMPSEFEFIHNDVENEEWIFKFEPNIRLPFKDVYCTSPFGLRVTAPEILLLHKAWYPARPKDEQDFMNVRNRLSIKQRTWLYQHLEQIRPNHPWLRQLET